MTPNAFLGRIIDEHGRSVGTCFQVSPGVIVTAAHVVRDTAPLTLDREALVGHVVSLSPLAPDSGQIGLARVTAVHPSSDVAVLFTDTHFPESVSHLAHSDVQSPGTDFLITGCATMAAGSEGEREFESLTTLGKWTRNAVTSDGYSLGSGTASGAELGMSGSPVLRAADNAVIGVMSGRHNSDEWSRHVVWLVRVEDLEAILPDGVDIPIYKDNSSLERNAKSLAIAYVDRDRLVRDELFTRPLAWQGPWDRAVAELRAGKVVVVSAPSGFGSTTFAEHLIARELNPRLRMARLDVGDWEKPAASVLPLLPWHAFILDLQDPDHDRPTAGFMGDLDSFSTQLRQAQSCLVVVVREDLWASRLSRSLGGISNITLADPPDSIELIERYFENRDPIMIPVIQDASVRTHLVGMTAIEASDAIGRIQRSLPANHHATDIGLLVNRVAESLDAHGEELDALFGDGDKGEGFKGVRRQASLDLEDRCLLLALSFCTSVPVRRAERHSRNILAELQEGSFVAPPRPDEIFAKAGIRGRLRRVKAKVVRGDVAELVRPSFGFAAVNYVWDNYEEIRRPLVKWICSAVKDESLRLTAAEWISSLVRRSQDVDFIRNELRLLLQNSADKGVLVEVLLNACRDQHMRRRAERLLYDWAHQPGSQEVVIRVSERLFLETGRAIALRRLQRVADSPRIDPDTMASVSKAFEAILVSEATRNDFLSAVSEWVAVDKSRSSTKLALSAVIRSAGGLDYLLQLGRGTADSSGLKQILAEMLLDPSSHSTIVDMFRSAGNSDATYERLIQALGGAAKEQGLVAALFRLAGALDVAVNGRKPVDDLSDYLEGDGLGAVAH